MLIQKGTWYSKYVTCIYGSFPRHVRLSRSTAAEANARDEVCERRLCHASLLRHSQPAEGHYNHSNCKNGDTSWLDSRHACVGREVRPGNSSCGSFQPGLDHKRVHEGSSRLRHRCKVGLYEGEKQVKIWTKLCHEGQLSEAVEALDLLVHRGSCLDNSVFYGVIKKCMAHKDLVLGGRVHALAVKSGYESNSFVANHIICMYSAHGRLDEAMRVFHKVAAPNRYMWASIILAHARNGEPTEAIKLYRQMRESTVRPNNHILVAALKACATAQDLSCGRDVHADILGGADKPDIFVNNCLVDMYTKCGSLEDARRVFDVLPDKDVVTWTAMIAGYAQHGLGEEALTLYADMQKECNTPANHVTFACLLQACALTGALYQGKQLHLMIQDRGLEADIVLGNSLINMYAKCGSLDDARSVFDNLLSRDVMTWNAMIAGYVQHARSQDALTLYASMHLHGSSLPDSVTFVCLLQACASVGGLEQGKEVHSAILNSILKVTDVFVATALVDMYSKCGSLEDACRVFDSLATKDLATWTAMIGAYTQHGFGQKAVDLYTDMQQDGISPTDGVIFVCLLQACATDRALHWGKKLHAQIQERALEADGDVGNCLVHMYAKCGSLEDAHRVFAKLESRSLATWNALIAGYVQCGLRQEAFALYGQMQLKGTMPPDAVTFVWLLQACASTGYLRQGKQFHAQIQQRGLESDLVVGNSLVHMYAKSGSIRDARTVFDNLPHRDVVTWNAMISGYTHLGLSHDALLLYEIMQQEGSVPGNAVTFVCLLQACASVGALGQGQQLHAAIQQIGLEADVAVGNSLVNMYAKCGNLEEAYRVFNNLPAKDVVTWNAMIAGYVQHGLGKEAIDLHGIMQHEGVTLGDAVTFACLLQACASTGALQQGEQFHRQIQGRGLEGDVGVGNCLVDMYAKCGRLEDARKVFYSMPTKDVITWNTMIAVYAQYGLGQESLTLFKDMQCEGITVATALTFVCLLQACGTKTGLETVKQLHAEFLDTQLDDNGLLVSNALIDIYGKCGSIVDAQQVFDGLPTRDVVTWSALIAGYARHGESDVVFDLFQQMREDGIQPNSITSLSVLAVCNHAGLVDRGQRFFYAMSKDYGISPTIEHYKCMVDLLGRAGLVDQAVKLVNAMPFQPDGEVWRSLLGACQKWNDLETARLAFECAMRLDQNDAAAFVLMANIYAAADRPDDAKEMQVLRVKAQAWKKPGQSWWTDFGGSAHTFVVGDSQHPQRQQIYTHLANLAVKMDVDECLAHVVLVS